MRAIRWLPGSNMYKIRTILLMSGLVLLLAAGSAYGIQSNEKLMPASSSTMPRPAVVIQSASREFIGALKRHQAEIKKNPGEVRRLAQRYILPHFDLQFTSRLILGHYWKTATPAQRKDFSRAFINHLIAAYEKGIVSYRKDRVQVLPLQGSANRQFISVETLVHIPDQDPVSVDYAMHKVNGEWKIFDVKVMQISFVLTFRNEYQAEISKTSLNALIEQLKKSQLPRKMAAIAPSSDS